MAILPDQQSNLAVTLDCTLCVSVILNGISNGKGYILFSDLSHANVLFQSPQHTQTLCTENREQRHYHRVLCWCVSMCIRVTKNYGVKTTVELLEPENQCDRRKCPYYIKTTIIVCKKLFMGKEKMSVLERCPHFRGVLLSGERFLCVY